MRRAHLALGFAAAALVSISYAIYRGLVCGMSTDMASIPGISASASGCASWVHPLLPIYALASVASFAAVWRDKPAIPLLLGVAGAAFGTLSGFSLGPSGVLASLCLVGCGVPADGVLARAGRVVDGKR